MGRAVPLAALGGLLLAPAAHAASILNGDFSIGLTHWETAPPGVVEVVDGAAALTDGHVYYTDGSSEQYGSGLWQGVTVTPGTPLVLSFDFKAPADSDDLALPSVYLLSDGLDEFRPWDPDSFDDVVEPLDAGVTETVSGPDGDGFQQYTLSFTSAYSIVVPTFEYLNWDDPPPGPESMYLVDNVSLTAVPLPASAWLLGAAVLALSVRARRRPAR